MRLSPTKRLLLVAGLVLAFDQLSKALILRFLGYGQQWIVLDGFFKVVCWRNTGAAWSLFSGSNKILAVVAAVALGGLFIYRQHFDFHTSSGQAGLGLMMGGILGNLMDRIMLHYVVDFLYFYLHGRGSGDIGFPAFNVADTAICTGVLLVFWTAWRNEGRGVPNSVSR